eukprot:14795-Heterococcus_DN1.PRE.1
MTHYSAVFTSASRVEFAHECGLTSTSEAYHRAAGKHGDIATLVAAHALGMQYTVLTMAAAGHCNKLAEVQYLLSKGCPWPTRLVYDAASAGHFELVRWCYEQKGPLWQVSAVAYQAAHSGNVALMEWLRQQRRPIFSEYVWDAAVQSGHVGMCQYLLEQRCDWSYDTASDAARYGHTELLRWIVDTGFLSTAPLVCKAAAQGGSADVLMYLQQEGLLSGSGLLTDALDTAGHYNKLAAAKWLRDQGAQWPTAFTLPWRGEVLAWARAEGCTTPIN